MGRLCSILGVVAALAYPSVHAQNPFSPLSRPADILTLSEGQYPEVFANDTLRRVGAFVYNTVTGKAYRWEGQREERGDEMRGATGHSCGVEHLAPSLRVGRFLSIDPLAAKYPFYSPYAFSGNRVIDMIELEGLEPTKPGSEEGEIQSAGVQGHDDWSQRNWLWMDGTWIGTPGEDVVEVKPSFGQEFAKGVFAFDRWFEGASGGYTMVDDYATGTNNADRKGNPSGTWDVTAIQARANSTFGPEKLTSVKLPAQGENALDKIVESFGSASGATQEGVGPAQSFDYGQAQAKPALKVVRDYQVNRTRDTISVASPDGRWNGDRYAPGDTIEIRDLYYKDGTYTGEKSTKKSGR